jgi:hypothetical protein
MEELLQPRPPAPPIGLPKPRRLCQNHGATRTSPRNLTFQLAPKGCPDQPPAAPAHPTGGGGTFCTRCCIDISGRRKILGRAGVQRPTPIRVQETGCGVAFLLPSAFGAKRGTHEAKSTSAGWSPSRISLVGGWLGKIIHTILLQFQRLQAGLTAKLALTQTGS